MIPFSFISDPSCLGISMQGSTLPAKKGGGPLIKLVYNPNLVGTPSLVEFLSIFKSPLMQQERFLKDKESMRLMNILSAMPDRDRDSLTKISLLEELQLRGYDLKTLRIEVVAEGQPIPKRIGRQTPGRLRSLYSKDEDGCLDVICWWSVPGCSKRDVNMLFYYFSGPAYIGPGLPVALKNLGLAPKSFLFQIDHMEKKAKRPSQEIEDIS